RPVIAGYISTVLHEGAIASFRSGQVLRERVVRLHRQPVETSLSEAHLQRVVVGEPGGSIHENTREPRELAVIRLPKLIASRDTSGRGTRYGFAGPRCGLVNVDHGCQVV